MGYTDLKEMVYTFVQGAVIQFEGEAGIDCGALTREWAKLLTQQVSLCSFFLFEMSYRLYCLKDSSLQLLRPSRCLFRRTPKGNRYALLPDQVIVCFIFVFQIAPNIPR
jgi:hypothetical protein